MTDARFAPDSAPVEDRDLGTSEPQLVLYLPNPPTIPAGHSGLDVPALIEYNGNHWRKILTILAKICSQEPDWRQYRDGKLLRGNFEAISFGTALRASARWHVVAGKASWQRLGLEPETFEPLNNEGRLLARDNVLLTPYPDYRQFPNRSIEQVREWLRRQGRA